MSNKVNVIIFHGGKLVDNGGHFQYIGGEMHVKKELDPDKLGRLEMLWYVRDLGYEKCGPLYYKLTGTAQFIEIESDTCVMNMLSRTTQGNFFEVYVDSVPVGYVTDQQYGGDGVVNRADVSSVANMVIKGYEKNVADASERQPNAEATKTRERQQILENVELDYDEQNDADYEEEDEDCTDYDSKSECTDNELLDANVDDDNGSDQDPELEEVRQSVKSYRKERSKRHRAPDPKVVELGEVGVDKGMEAYLRDGNKYAGLLGGDEEYIGSSDVDSFASEDENGDIPKRSRRVNKRVLYDEDCEEPLWELGMVFKNVYQFRDAIAKYAVKKGVELEFIKNDYYRVRVGKPGGIVISTSAKIIKNSAHVTGDIGFTPTSLKWKGKAAMTPQQLKNQKSNFRPVNVTHQAASTQPSYASSTAASRAGTTSKSQPNVTKWF